MLGGAVDELPLDLLNPHPRLPQTEAHHLLGLGGAGERDDEAVAAAVRESVAADQLHHPGSLV